MNVIGSVPSDHPMIAVLQDLASPTKGLPEAFQVDQEAWGGIPECWDAFVLVLTIANRKNVWDLQNFENVINSDICPWTLVRTFGMWSSTTDIADGHKFGPLSEEATILGTVITMRLAALVAIRHLQVMPKRVIQLHVDELTASKSGALSAWEAFQRLFQAVEESLVHAVAAGRTDVSGNRHYPVPS